MVLVWSAGHDNDAHVLAFCGNIIGGAILGMLWHMKDTFMTLMSRTKDWLLLCQPNYQLSQKELLAYLLLCGDECHHCFGWCVAPILSSVNVCPRFVWTNYKAIRRQIASHNGQFYQTNVWCEYLAAYSQTYHRIQNRNLSSTSLGGK